MVRAEIAGKLSTSSPLPQDRLEDTLTDAVSSALRYLPREALNHWLRLVLPDSCMQHLTPPALDSALTQFWPTLPGGAEPDVLMVIGSLLIVIEAKYHSGFGTNWEQPQLVVEFNQAQRLASSRGLEGPVVVAITATATEPMEIGQAIELIEPSGRLSPRESVRWCTWQSIAKAIEVSSEQSWGTGHQAVVEDVLELMTKREVRYMYEGFQLSDWWLLGAAAEAASTRVYPTIAVFTRELIAEGATRDIVWSSFDSGVVWRDSKHLSNTDRWHRDYVELPLSHNQFGKKVKPNCSLYVLFTFNNPAIHSGWWFRPVPSETLTNHAAGIVAWLQGLPDELSVRQTATWRALGAPLDRTAITAAWLEKVSRTGDTICVDRSWSPDELTSTEQVLDVLSDLAASLLDDGAVIASLEADGTLDRSQAPAAIPPTASDPDDDSTDTPSI